MSRRPTTLPRLALAALWTMTVCGSPEARAADWPRFRGPNGTGVAETSGLPAQFGRDQNLIWKTTIPSGHSSPVLSGDRVFLTAAENERLYTLSLSRATGEELWRRECPRPRIERLDRRNHPASPSAAADGQSVYVFFGDFGLLSYDFDGNERWRRPLGPFNNSYGMGASPILVDDVVVLVCDQRADSFVIALDKRDGSVRWKRSRRDAVSGHSTPIVYRAGAGDAQIIAPGSFRMDAYAAGTGESLWWAYGLPSEMKSVPVVDAGTVYLSGYNVAENDPGRQVEVPPFEQVLAEHDEDRNGRLSREELPEGQSRKFVGFADVNRDAQLDASEWRVYAAAMASENGLRAVRLGGNGDMTRSSLRWKYQKAVPQLPSPLLYRGVLYMINDGGILTLLDPETGEVSRRLRLSGAIDHYYASPVAADDKVFFVSESGSVTVLRAGGTPEILAVNQFGEDCYATPAIGDGRIYIRTAITLYCFGKSR